ncbi:diguanylate cyclase (GGDEF) domain-containing protein [Kaistia soli DSM 19436]|uniref:Diguanylate cyclase (GGDEF) domain-containing protein n=1 Tax=Kaistia soli DSM 19436 TaxID=1122133 RepID=A0A1M4VAU9_9HYPH|nr:EAL domain-containing protein [Kaistia soli]SHE65938.1 diguanylate cyclase (GGDEF) domain-containing protein [Kaistia soli DSM 19436]
MIGVVNDIEGSIEDATHFCDVRDLLAAWKAAEADAGGVPERSTFLAGPAARIVDRLMVLSVFDDTLIYQKVGSTIISLFGHDPTGRRLSDIDNPGVRPFVRRYIEAVQGDQPRFSIQDHIGLNSIGTNERLLLPVRTGETRELVVYVRSREDAKDLMRSVFNASTDSISVMEALRDQTGRICDFKLIAVNAEGAARMKSEPDAIIGTFLTNNFPASRSNGILQRMIAAIESQQRDVFETRYPHQGSIVERQLRIAPHGERLTVTNIDLGPQRMAARAIVRQRNELLTANRLLALQAENLRAINETIEASSRELRAEIERNRALEAELIYRARFDGLTDLPNRSYFEIRFHEIIEESRRTGRRVALCILDVDHFKDINDRFGHSTGDIVLREVSARLTRTIRSTDIAGRLGGDEFAVLLIDAGDAYDAQSAVARILTEVMGPLTVLRQDVPVSVSAGIAVFPGDAQGEMELMTAADLAVYRAKRTGRARAVFFDPAMRAEADRRTRLMQSLAGGIAAGEIKPHYQPLLDLRTEQLVGFEALARWHHPTESILSPAHFSEAFDEPDLARAVSATMIDQVTADLARWRGTAIPSHVSLNVTAFDLRSECFAAELRQKMAQRGLSTKQLGIEVTETTVVSRDGEKMVATLTALRQLGFSVALDDFGTGFASLTHLITLPCDTLKIDRTFVTDLDSSSKTAAVVRSMVTLAGALGLDIVAEGVETRAELEAIRALDCHLVQGYLISKPLPAEAVPAFVASFAPRAAQRRVAGA